MYLTGVSSACLLEIEKRELSRFSSAGLPETTELPVLLSPLAEGTELRLHLEYRLPDVPGPNQFNEADCTVNGGSVVKLILKH